MNWSRWRYYRPDRLWAEVRRRLWWAAIGAACLGLPAWLAGMAIGARDHRLASVYDRHEAALRCQADAGLPLLLVRDWRDPARDQWICTTGSGRVLMDGRR